VRFIYRNGGNITTVDSRLVATSSLEVAAFCSMVLVSSVIIRLFVSFGGGGGGKLLFMSVILPRNVHSWRATIMFATAWDSLWVFLKGTLFDKERRMRTLKCQFDLSTPYF